MAFFMRSHWAAAPILSTWEWASYRRPVAASYGAGVVKGVGAGEGIAGAAVAATVGGAVAAGPAMLGGPVLAVVAACVHATKAAAAAAPK